MAPLTDSATKNSTSFAMKNNWDMKRGNSAHISPRKLFHKLEIQVVTVVVLEREEDGE